jgi:hypothetical protein
MPFKCFNFVNVVHFSAKCPYPKEDPEDVEEKNKQYKKKGKPNYKKGFYKGKNIFYSKEKNNSSLESSDSDDDELLFLGI